MKLKVFIQEYHDGSVKAFADDNNYHVTQVHRFIAQGAYYNNGKPYFKKYLKVKANETNLSTTSK
jgi:hypothetical protein